MLEDASVETARSAGELVEAVVEDAGPQVAQMIAAMEVHDGNGTNPADTPPAAPPVATNAAGTGRQQRVGRFQQLRTWATRMMRQQPQARQQRQQQARPEEQQERVRPPVPLENLADPGFLDWNHRFETVVARLRAIEQALGATRHDEAGWDATSRTRLDAVVERSLLAIGRSYNTVSGFEPVYPVLVRDMYASRAQYLTTVIAWAADRVAEMRVDGARIRVPPVHVAPVPAAPDARAVVPLAAVGTLPATEPAADDDDDTTTAPSVPESNDLAVPSEPESADQPSGSGAGGSGDAAKGEGDAEKDNDDDWLAQNTKDCPRCYRPCQLVMGCDHVTCTCGFEFCWLCRHPWKEIGGYNHVSKCPGEKEKPLPTDAELEQEYERFRKVNAAAASGGAASGPGPASEAQKPSDRERWLKERKKRETQMRNQYQGRPDRGRLELGELLMLELGGFGIMGMREAAAARHRQRAERMVRQQEAEARQNEARQQLEERERFVLNRALGEAAGNTEVPEQQAEAGYSAYTRVEALLRDAAAAEASRDAAAADGVLGLALATAHGAQASCQHALAYSLVHSFVTGAIGTEPGLVEFHRAALEEAVAALTDALANHVSAADDAEADEGRVDADADATMMDVDDAVATTQGPTDNATRTTDGNLHDLAEVANKRRDNFLAEYVAHAAPQQEAVQKRSALPVSVPDDTLAKRAKA